MAKSRFIGVAVRLSYSIESMVPGPGSLNTEFRFIVSGVELYKFRKLQTREIILYQEEKNMDLFEAISKRRTIRTFTGKKIPRSDLEKIVDAGILAPSATNRQMRDFILITKEEILNDILHHFHAGRKYETHEDGKFDGTSAIIAVVMDETNEFWREDGSAATENMLLSARALGYGSCWIEGQIRAHEEHFKELLGTPEGKRILLMIALGEPVKWSPSPPKKPLSEVLHWERYEN